MASVEEDYKRPLKDIYEGFSDSAKKSIDCDVFKIWTYFTFWSVFIVISAIFIFFFLGCNVIDEPLGKQVQRVGSIISFFAVVGEALFIVKINKLASVIHPAKLVYEIYLHRRFKVLVNLSIAFTFMFVCLGAVLSGYGDILL
ncbi:hypothetical protein [Pseudoalteromonas rhizosphaerae]|uniref:hypothetical protein n=1 Tax=Pseudoalteromonas rhizosphaerae TaxID=2518973 RepID=UPI00384F0147